MNKAAIIATADAILAACDPKSDTKLGFNMEQYKGELGECVDRTGHGCKTTACIAGWALVAHGKRLLIDDDETGEKAQKILGLETDDAHALFCSYTCLSNDSNSISPLQAVATLYHLAATGKVDRDAKFKPAKSPAKPTPRKAAGKNKPAAKKIAVKKPH